MRACLCVYLRCLIRVVLVFFFSFRSHTVESRQRAWWWVHSLLISLLFRCRCCCQCYKRSNRMHTRTQTHSTVLGAAAIWIVAVNAGWVGRLFWCIALCLQIRDCGRQKITRPWFHDHCVPLTARSAVRIGDRPATMDGSAARHDGIIIATKCCAHECTRNACMSHMKHCVQTTTVTSYRPNEWMTEDEANKKKGARNESKKKNRRHCCCC